MIKEYEVLAKNHMDQYFALLKRRQDDPGHDQANDNIGHRRQLAESPRDKMVEYLALEFFGRLLESFHDFRDYCAHNEHDADCIAISDSSGDDKLLLSQAFDNWI